MVFISCFANFERKQSDSVGRMTAQPCNRFVFLCRGRGVCCKWKPDFVTFLYKDKMVVTRTFYFMRCQSSLLSTVIISFVYKDKWWFDESMSVIFCMENI